jgi:tetratricopeptide (TPR) repeat protein
MRGEEVISRGSASMALSAIRAILAFKVIQYDYYGAIYFLRRLTPSQVGAGDLRACVQFLEGVAFLMKKRGEEGLKKLEQAGKLLDGVLDEFNRQVHQNYRLFIVYAHFLEGRYGRCLREAAAQREVGVQPYWDDTLGYIECICTAMLSYNDRDYNECEKQLRDCILAHPQRA